MTSSSLNQYIQNNASLPPDCVLGHIAWFEVADGSYDGTKLEMLFARHSLNPGFLPPEINPADAFEKATKQVAGFKYPVLLPGGAQATAEIMVREAARTDSQIQRHLIREVRDDQARRLSYDKVGEFVFYKAKVGSNGKVDRSSVAVRSTLESSLSDGERQVLSGLTIEFDAAFDRFRHYHDGQKIRAVMRSYLLYLNAVLMKSSVYFVHSNRGDELLRLQAAAAEMDGVSLTLWQIPDLEVHRREVVEAFQRESEKDLENVVKEIQKLRTERKTVSPGQYQRVKALYDDVLTRSGEYRRTLQISQDRTSAASEIALESLVELQRQVFAGVL